MTTPGITAQCLAEQAGRGPRYTSYPPATEFRALAEADINEELDRVKADGEPLSLYVHVPFCRSLCWYCGCNVIPTRDLSRGEPYVDSLATELAILSNALGAGFPVAELALGGGSPNFLAPKTLRVLVESVRRYFSLASDARLSIELDPRNTTSAQLDAFAGAGFRAMSVGVQDFSAAVQDAIHRHQTAEQTRWLIEQARARGFTDVNVDIVYGLPHQNEDSFARTLDTVIGLRPDRIALFGYAHLPSRLPHQQLVERAGRVLDRYERATLLLEAIERLTGAGYLHLGLDHFARPDSALARAAQAGRMARSFQGYVERRAATTLGVGVTAISSTPRMFWQNHAELADWQVAIGRAKPPVARGVVLDQDDRVRGALIERLMCDGEIELDRLGQQFGIDPRAYFARELDLLAAQPELARYEVDANAIRTTPVGKLLVRNVCMVFDRYVRDGNRFSPTI